MAPSTPPQYARPAYYTTAEIESLITRICDVVVECLVAKVPTLVNLTPSSEVIPSLEPKAPTAEPQLEPQPPSPRRRRRRASKRSAKPTIESSSYVETKKNLPGPQLAPKTDVTARMQLRLPQHSSPCLRHRLQAYKTILWDAKEASVYAGDDVQTYHAIGGLVPMPLRDTS